MCDCLCARLCVYASKLRGREGKGQQRDSNGSFRTMINCCSVQIMTSGHTRSLITAQWLNQKLIKQTPFTDSVTCTNCPNPFSVISDSHLGFCRPKGSSCAFLCPYCLYACTRRVMVACWIRFFISASETVGKNTWKTTVNHDAYIYKMTKNNSKSNLSIYEQIFKRRIKLKGAIVCHLF